MEGQNYNTGTSESVKKTIDGMDKPFIMVIETDNGYLDDYDRFYNMAELLTKLGDRLKSGHSSGLIRDRHDNVIGRYDWH